LTTRKKQLQPFDAPSPYIYHPLNYHRQEIRLLRVLPARNNDEPISCVLEIASLQDSPCYTALSYCWGDPSNSKTVLVNTSIFRTTDNLASALWYIRKHFASGSLIDDLPQLLWIDAICINQENLEERNRQIRLMQTVYASAANVLSWLGCGDDLISRAFDFIRQTVKAAHCSTRASANERQRLDSGPRVGSGVTEDSIMVETIVDPRILFLLSRSESVIDFFSLAYWHRVWIVQEIVLTRPDRNIIVFGDEIMSFRDVQVFRNTWLAFLKELQLNRKWESALSRAPGWDLASDSWTQYLQRMEESLVVWSYYDFMRGQRDLLASQESLFYIILATAYNATDPRDSVFGLLGIISSPKLVPDYMKQVEVIYTEWFTTVLKDWEDFQPLYFSGITNTLYSEGVLSSWVPDLRSRRADSPVWDATLAGTIEKPHQPTSFSLGEHALRGFPYISEGRMLHARGVWCDEVVEVHHINFTYAAEKVAQFCTSCLSNDKISQDRNRNNAPILQRVFTVLMCGINRFDSSQTENRTSLTSRNFQVMQGTNQLQLNKTMPLFQAVAKFLQSRGTLSTEGSDDLVLNILCRPSSPLGANIYSDIQLAAAFVAFLQTSQRSQSASSFPPSHGLAPGPDFLRRFLECFFRDRAEELENLVSYDLFQEENVLLLVKSIQRYFKTYDHTLFFTRSGYLGNGPTSMRVGDKVAVLDGAKMPFLLRNRVGCFVLVGPCYVEGYSDGEPAAMARRGEVPVEDILIN
jgi:hypothetical protein